MVKQVNIEETAKKDEFLNTKPLSKEEITKALDECIKQIDINMDYFKEQFPFSCTKNNKYDIIGHEEWTEGFWTGMLWLAYEYTNDEKYRKLAEKNVDSFYDRVLNRVKLDHHDLGFLYSLSCVSAYKLTGNEKAKQAGILAADKLLERWQEKGQFLQAWGEAGNPDHYRFIIDCMLNIPLLYWASEVTGNQKYADIAARHFDTNCKYVIRDDASAFHTFYMDPITGGPSHGATKQGYSDDSSWARGQAWGIYGLPLNVRYTHRNDVFDLYKGMTNYFLNRLPEDNVCYWDLIFTNNPEQSKDSSAAAIACCGMHEMNKYLDPNDPNVKIYTGAYNNILRSLIKNYTNDVHNEGNPLLYHGVYSWHSKGRNKGIDEGNTWGDYFYMEALMRLYKEWNLYW